MRGDGPWGVFWPPTRRAALLAARAAGCAGRQSAVDPAGPSAGTDMIPGRVSRMALRADRPGIYRGQCAEYCGARHALMAFDVLAMPRGDFDALTQVGARRMIGETALRATPRRYRHDVRDVLLRAPP